MLDFVKLASWYTGRTCHHPQAQLKAVLWGIQLYHRRGISLPHHLWRALKVTKHFDFQYFIWPNLNCWCSPANDHQKQKQNWVFYWWTREAAYIGDMRCFDVRNPEADYRIGAYIGDFGKHSRQQECIVGWVLWTWKQFKKQMSW